MSCIHEFGIINNFDRRKSYNDYTPEKYHCVSVHDDVISRMSKQFANMKTYFHSFNRPEFGLAYWGITIIPPESLSLFLDVVLSTSSLYKNSNELNELASKISQAIKTRKFMIHFGI